MMTLTELRHAVEATPTNPAALAALGHAFTKRDQFEESLPCFREALRLAGGDVAEYHFQLSRVLHELGAPDEAASHLERAHALDPDCTRTLWALGWLCCARLRRFDDARRLLLRLLGLQFSQRTLVGYCRASIAEGGPFDQLLASAAEQTANYCDRRVLHHCMARALMLNGRYEEARGCLAGAPGDGPLPADFLNDWAHVEHALGNIVDARIYHERAFDWYPDDIEAIWRYLEFLFRRGEYQHAREIYRQEEIQRAIHGPSTGQRWTGESLRGKTLLFRPRGRYGDMVLFGRFASLLADLGADVIVESTKPVQPLLSTLPGVRAVWLAHDEPIAYDLYCDRTPAIMLLDWDWETLGKQVPYLSAAPDRVERWRARTACDGRLRIGVVWRAGFDFEQQYDDYSSRSMPAACLRPLADIPGVALYNLFIGRAASEELEAIVPPLPIEPLSGGFTGGLSDYAAAIEALDLIVTVDTAAAHVAGALGKSCLLMLPYLPAIRWGDAGHDSRWYPQCRMFRQPSPGDWRAVLRSVCDDVRRRVAEAGMIRLRQTG